MSSEPKWDEDEIQTRPGNMSVRPPESRPLRGSQVRRVKKKKVDSGGFPGSSGRPAEPSHIGILFLAHNGVNQGPLWQRWRESGGQDKKQRVHFFVHLGGNEPPKNDQFAQKYAVPGSELLKTGWGDSSLVYAYQQGLKYILGKNRNIGVIHFVSGADVPVQSVGRVFKETRTRFRATGDSDHLPKKSVRVAISDGTPSKKYYTIRPDEMFNHQQWHCVTREDAEIVAGTDFSVFDTWDSHFKKLKEIDGISHEVPDEYYVGTVLKKVNGWDAGTLKDRFAEYYTDYHWPDPDAVSPHNFTDHDTEIGEDGGPDEDGPLSLRDILSEEPTGEITEHRLWFRKVGSEVDFSDPENQYIPWLVAANNAKEEEEKKGTSSSSSHTSVVDTTGSVVETERLSSPSRLAHTHVDRIDLTQTDDEDTRDGENGIGDFSNLSRPELIALVKSIRTSPAEQKATASSSELQAFIRVNQERLTSR